MVRLLRSCDCIQYAKVADNKMYFFTVKEMRMRFKEWEAKLRVPFLSDLICQIVSVSDRSIHSDDNPAGTFLFMPAGDKFRKS